MEAGSLAPGTGAKPRSRVIGGRDIPSPGLSMHVHREWKWTNARIKEIIARQGVGIDGNTVRFLKAGNT